MITMWACHAVSYVHRCFFWSNTKPNVTIVWSVCGYRWYKSQLQRGKHVIFFFQAEARIQLWQFVCIQFHWKFEINAFGTTWSLLLNKPYADSGGEDSKRVDPNGEVEGCEFYHLVLHHSQYKHSSTLQDMTWSQRFNQLSKYIQKVQ